MGLTSLLDPVTVARLRGKSVEELGEAFVPTND